MTYTVHHIFAVISSWFHIAYNLTHCSHFHSKNHECKNNPLYIWGEALHTFLCQKPSVYLWRNSSHMFWCQKPSVDLWRMFLCQKTVHTSFECTTTMGEVLINLVCQYPAVWDKQDAKYKGSNYKDAKWKEIAEILCLTKEDVIKKWKSLRNTFMRQ